MGRPRKSGLDYFPVDSDIFDDFGIRILISRYGMDGFGLYMYILTKVYKDRGYYLKADEDLEYIISTDLRMSVEKVRQVLAYLYSRSLLERIEIRDRGVSRSADSGKLVTPVTAITSTGIQRRYQEAVKSRGQKNAVEVKQELWLLEEKETQPFIKVLPSLSISGNNESFSEKNQSFSEKNAINKRKVNKSKSKVKKSICEPPKNPYLTDEEANGEFERYLDMRREREDISEAQISGLIGKLIEISEDPTVQRKVIRESIIHGWKSFFPLKPEGTVAAAGEKRRKGSFYNFEERQRSEEEKKELEKRLLGLAPVKEGIG